MALKVTDAERRERFIAIIGEIDASTDSGVYDAAFKALDKQQQVDARAPGKPE